MEEIPGYDNGVLVGDVRHFAGGDGLDTFVLAVHQFFEEPNQSQF